MQTHKKVFSHSLVALLFAPLVGCGSNATPVNSASTTGPSGKVIQGAVRGATIWADSLTSGTRFVTDTVEQDTQTTTDGNGSYTLPSTPSYKYIIVTQGGTDTITGLTATTMLAPGGAKSVSALTTLVALDTTGSLAATLNAMLPSGQTFDSDFTAANALTPASTVLTTSITSAVTSFTTAIRSAATANGVTLTSRQLNNIQLTLYSQIATQFATLTPAALSNTETLSLNLETALTAAFNNITTNNSNIVGINSVTIADDIARNAVYTAANIVGYATNNTTLEGVTWANVQGTSVPVPSTPVLTEAAVMASSGNTTRFTSNVSSTAAGVASTITVTGTPPNYNPPTITIINNPSVIGYSLIVNATGSTWNVGSFTITFSDDMVASTSGGTNYAHSVLNPANYAFTPTGCTPSSYAAGVVTFTCSSALPPGNFTILIPRATSTSGVWASSTSLGLVVDTTKVYVLPFTTGSTGGSSLNLF